MISGLQLHTTTFVCSLNPICQTSIPRLCTVISLLSSHPCSSQPSQLHLQYVMNIPRLINVDMTNGFAMKTLKISPPETILAL